MKIAIFGNSFATSKKNHSWVTLLSQIHEVDCFAYDGTCFFHCYQTMLKTDLANYDAVIVTISNYERVYGGYYDDITCPLPSVEHLLYKQKHATARDNVDRMEAGIQYYLHLSDNELNEYLHEKITQDIVNMVECKLILLPSFNHSYTPTVYSHSDYVEYGFSTMDIVEMERKHLGISGAAVENNEYLFNHMCAENNVILFELLNDIIAGSNDKISISRFVLPPHNASTYYR